MRFQLATVVLPAATRANIKALMVRLEKDDLGDGMFTTKVNATGTGTTTHYISSGYMPHAFLRLMRNPVLMFNTAKAAWEADGDVFPLTQTQVTNRLNQCTIVMGGDIMVDGVPTAPTPRVEEGPLPETPHQTLARIGLALIAEPLA